MMSYSMTKQYNTANDELFDDTTISHSQWWTIQKYNLSNDELFDDILEMAF